MKCTGIYEARLIKANERTNQPNRMNKTNNNESGEEKKTVIVAWRQCEKCDVYTADWNGNLRKFIERRYIHFTPDPLALVHFNQIIFSWSWIPLAANLPKRKIISHHDDNASRLRNVSYEKKNAQEKPRISSMSKVNYLRFTAHEQYILHEPLVACTRARVEIGEWKIKHKLVRKS